MVQTQKQESLFSEMGINSNQSEKKNNKTSGFSDLFSKITKEKEDKISEKKDLNAKVLTETEGKLINQIKKSEIQLEKLEDILKELPEEIVELLAELIEKIETEGEGNAEFSKMLDEIKKIVSMAQNSLAEKQKSKVHDKKDIEKMLEEIDGIFKDLTGKSLKIEMVSEGEGEELKLSLTQDLSGEENTLQNNNNNLSEYEKLVEKNNNSKEKNFTVREKTEGKISEHEIIRIVEKETEDGEGNKILLRAIISVEKVEKDNNNDNLMIDNSDKFNFNFEALKNNNNVSERVTKETPQDFTQEPRHEPSTVMQNIFTKAKFVQNGSTQEMNFKMNPENLGSVKVTVINEEGKITIRMFTQNEGAREALASNLGELRQNVQREGLNVSEVHISVNPDGKNNKDDNQESEEEKQRKNRKKERMVSFRDVMQAFGAKSPASVSLNA
ncbi:MAG: flagellar hook-length control protein FliK [Candidatus Muiribacteriota bacterium]